MDCDNILLNCNLSSLRFITWYESVGSNMVIRLFD